MRGDEKPLGRSREPNRPGFIALSKQRLAKGDEATNYFPQLSFFAQYNRNTTLLNNVNSFFAHPLPANNFSSGFRDPGAAVRHGASSQGTRIRGRRLASDR